MRMNEHVRQVSEDQSKTVKRGALTKGGQDDDETNRVQEECCSVQKWKNYSEVFTFCQAHKHNKLKFLR